MKPKITVVPLGPGSPELMTMQTVRTLKEAKRVVLRTERHPVSDWLNTEGIPFSSLDSFYDRFDDFDMMHRAMADWLWQEAAHGAVCFCVMDPARDGSVAALKASRPESSVLTILPGLSPLDACEPVLTDNVRTERGLRVFTASDFLSAPAEPSLSLWILELDSPLLAGDVKLKLAECCNDETDVFFFPPSDAVPRPVRRIPLSRLDSQRLYDHRAAVFIPGLDYLHRERHTWEDLAAILSRLRAPDGCPWDKIQTHASLTPYMVEEAWEAVSAIEDDDMDHLADELGDVLFQVFFHASIAESFDEFTLTDVLTHICRKMIQRHPHVFMQAHGETAEQISAGWESMKRAETGSRTVGETLNDVSPALPSLKYSIKIFKKLAQIPALRRNPEEIAGEIRNLSAHLLNQGSLSEDTMSSLLMKCTELCYRTDRDAEILLHRGVDRLKQAFQRAEASALQNEKSPETLTNQQLCVYLNTDEEKKD